MAVETPRGGHFSRIDVMELKLQFFKKLGRVKAEKYFFHLRRFLSFKLGKSEFNKLCHVIVGKENVALHNMFIQSILTNACLANAPPARETNTGSSWNSKISNGSFGDTFPPSPGKGRSLNSRDRKFRDRPSSLGPHGKVPSGSIQEITGSCDIQLPREQQSAPGSKALLEIGSVEDGEEVEQVRGSPCVQSRSPIRAPLGIPISIGAVSSRTVGKGPAASFHLSKSYVPDTCDSCCELPDTGSLRRRLEHRVGLEGLDLSADCANLLNVGLDAFLRRLIKPCVDLASARCNNELTNQIIGNLVSGKNGVWQKERSQRSNQSRRASLLDFRIAMEANPQLLGENWPVQLEKICLRASEE